MKFGVISDCQYADVDDWKPGEFDRRYRLSLKKLQEAIDFFNQQELEFVVHLGDIIDRDINNFGALKLILDSSKHQIFHVLGNHDFYVTTELDNERNNHQKLLSILNMPSKYYSFKKDSFKFLVLDTNEVGTIEWEQNTSEYKHGLEVLKSEQAKGRIYAKSWNGAVSITQLDWIKSEIKQSVVSSEKIVLLAHHQLFPENRENMLEKEKVLKLLDENSNVVAFLNGHNHHGDFGIYQGVPCVTFKGMVEQETNSYAVVEIDSVSLKIEGYGREESKSINLKSS